MMLRQKKFNMEHVEIGNPLVGHFSLLVLSSKRPSLHSLNWIHFLRDLESWLKRTAKSRKASLKINIPTTTSFRESTPIIWKKCRETNSFCFLPGSFNQYAGISCSPTAKIKISVLAQTFGFVFAQQILVFRQNLLEFPFSTVHFQCSCFFESEWGWKSTLSPSRLKEMS